MQLTTILHRDIKFWLSYNKQTGHRFKFAFQTLSGNTFSGTTRSLSLNSAFIECQPLTGPVVTRPKVNDMGMIKLFLTIDNNMVSVNSRCRITSIQPDGLDVDAQFAYMNKTDLANFENIIRGA